MRVCIPKLFRRKNTKTTDVKCYCKCGTWIWASRLSTIANCKECGARWAGGTLGDPQITAVEWNDLETNNANAFTERFRQLREEAKDAERFSIITPTKP